MSCLVLLGMLLVGVSALVWKAHAEQTEHLRVSAETIAAIDTVNQVRIGMLEAIRGERGYILTGNASYLEPYSRGRLQMLAGLAKLDRIPLVQREHLTLTSRLRALSTLYLGHLGHMIAERREGEFHDVTRIHLTPLARDQIAEMDRLLGIIDQAERGEMAQVSNGEKSVLAATRWSVAALALIGLLLLAVATAALVALQRSQERERSTREELRLLAQTDDLTGLANRRAFMAALNRHVLLARRHGTPLTLAIFDIDHFKLVNDRHGHGAGDEVIRRIAKVATSVMRESDVVGRIGGEEFAILLPGATLQRATNVCERLRLEVRRKAITTECDTLLSVTISTGLAELDALDDASQLLERADQALYHAKNAGRDRVCRAA